MDAPVSVCLLALLPLLLGAWVACLLHEHGMLALWRLTSRTRSRPGGRLLFLAMAAAAVVYGGSKGGGGTPGPEDPIEPPPQVESVEEHDVDEGANVFLISSLPCVIKGRTLTQSIQSIQFGIGMASVVTPIAIHTYTGTGTVYSARLSWADGYVDLSNEAQNVLLVPETEYMIQIVAENVSVDSQYVIRIGTFDPQLVVTFDGNDGNVPEQWRSYQPGKPYGSFPAATREGYDFTGWATAATDGIVMSVDTIACVGYTNLFAQWKRSVEEPVVVTNYVSFVGNGGEGAMDEQMFIADEVQALSSNLFARATYNFVGWATSPTGEVVYADGAIVSNLSETAGNIVLYAQWERMANVYDVVFNPSQGQGTMESQAFFLGEPQPIAANLFVRSGYDFTGWATASNGVAVYADCQIVTNVATNAGAVVTLYAAWKISPLPILTNTIDGVTWLYTVTNGQATIMCHSNEVFGTALRPLSVANLNVPEILPDGTGTNACTVTAIGENAFIGLASLTNVVVPATVSTLPAGVFAGCGNIVSATIPVSEPVFSVMPDSCTKVRSVKVPGVEMYLDEDVAVCEYAFSNCTALAEVDLPLGVTELPEGVFCGCSSLAAFEMPYTVTTIGEGAFKGCTALTAITVTENVEEIGANAFTGCSRLRIVRYLGDEPDASEGDSENIYYHSSSNLVSGYLRGIRSWPSAESSSGGDDDVSIDDGDGDDDDNQSQSSKTSARVATSVKWPEGTAGRPLISWSTSLYKFKKITFNYNDGGKTASRELIYVKGRVICNVPDVTTDGFEGWFTERYGGHEVDPYTVVDSAMTFYAHWSGDTSGTGSRGPVDALSPLYSDEDGDFAFTAATFDGVLVSETSGEVAGTIRVKTKSGRLVASAGGTNSPFTATMQVLGAKKISMSGTVGADGTAFVENERKGLALDLEFTQFGLSGTYSVKGVDYEIVGARDRYSAGSDAARNLVRAALANARRNWIVVLPTGDVEGNGAPSVSGYGVLSISVDAKGKGKIRGTMADGTKVSVSSTLLVGDSCCCLPVVVPLYSGKKGGFAFAIWFTWSEDASESETSVVGLSSWDATANSSAPFTATFDSPLVGVAGASSVPMTSTFKMDDFFDFDGIDETFSPNGTEIVASQSRWSLPKCHSVKFSKEDGWFTPDGKDYGNPAGLKLTYTAKTGLFKGSFKIFVEPSPGKSKKYTATVTGAVVDGVGYGTATVKKTGSLPVMVE